MLVVADLTATATLILAGITLLLAAGTVALVIVTRQGTAQARADAKAELELLHRQFGAGHRPLLVDVLTTAPAPDDMGADQDFTTAPQGRYIEYPGPTIETGFPNYGPKRIDPRRAFVAIERAMVFLSVPLRNVGRGLAVIEDGGVRMLGSGVGELGHRAIQRRHVPVGETTRVDLIAAFHSQGATQANGTSIQLIVPYTDFAGEQRTFARLQIVCRSDDINGPWLVEQVSQAEQRTPPVLATATSAEPRWLARMPSFVQRQIRWFLEARRTI